MGTTEEEVIGDLCGPLLVTFLYLFIRYMKKAHSDIAKNPVKGKLFLNFINDNNSLMQGTLNTAVAHKMDVAWCSILELTATLTNETHKRFCLSNAKKGAAPIVQNPETTTEELPIAIETGEPVHAG
jgi:hypothetical protein